ncbi:Hydrogen cyanide synthase subunit HcnA [Pandoraea terrae]|uniref:Hydrogen cyanide synthase subunit HcnA n=1 Tax=Pandoraea terrae TaxID=1537710 RepID=A0A5E4XM98_9BURK|nr:(2Fe-2S)-binding protein [Pandoraea terrae]VVE37403.1 Hydrogen cyanide synthase subunit HcnA [Pandoraea terrae]
MSDSSREILPEDARMPSRARFVRVAEAGRNTFRMSVDGRMIDACEGDTLMVALLTTQNALRDSEFGGERRAGFCLMGACQDCWVWTRDGARLRACTTPAAPGMAIVTRLVRGGDATMTTAAGEDVWPRV